MTNIKSKRSPSTASTPQHFIVCGVNMTDYDRRQILLIVMITETYHLKSYSKASEQAQ